MKHIRSDTGNKTPNKQQSFKSSKRLSYHTKRKQYPKRILATKRTGKAGLEIITSTRLHQRLEIITSTGIGLTRVFLFTPYIRTHTKPLQDTKDSKTEANDSVISGLRSPLFPQLANAKVLASVGLTRVLLIVYKKCKKICSFGSRLSFGQFIKQKMSMKNFTDSLLK